MSERAQVVVVAGGLGTRVAHLTGGRPKTLIEVGGRPFLDLQLAWLRDAGHVHFCLGMGGGEIRQRLEQQDELRSWSASHEHEPLGVVGALRHALPALGPWFIVLLGDVLPAVAFSELEAAATAVAAEGRSALVVAPSSSEPGQRGNTRVDGGLVVAYAKDGPPLPYVHAGASVLQRADLEASAARDELDLYAPLAAAGRLAAVHVPARSSEVGSEEGIAALGARLERERG